MIKNVKTAIILCGGLGTRLRSVIGENQKSMANVKGKPFLEILVEYLKSEGIKHIVFAVGYKSESVKEYFENKNSESSANGKNSADESGENIGDIKYSFAEEKELLGTAGAIKNAAKYLADDDDMTYVLNGDTLFKIDLSILEKNMIDNNTDLSIAVKNIKNEGHGRYGSIDFNNGLITSYIEKKEDANTNYISGGIYLIKKSLILNEIPDGKVSFEIDFMPKLMKENRRLGAVESEVSFIDIGTADTYERINK